MDPIPGPRLSFGRFIPTFEQFLSGNPNCFGGVFLEDSLHNQNRKIEHYPIGKSIINIAVI